MTTPQANAPLPWEGQPYSVKRFGVTITNCDSEPVQAPGCIQAHGALLVLRPLDLVILQASENTRGLLGLPPDSLLRRPVSVALGAGRQDRLREFLTTEPAECNPLYIFTLPARDGVPPLDVSVHTVEGVVVVELEATSRFEAEPDYYSLLKKTIGRLGTATKITDFCHVITEELRSVTGMDRVMIYKFHPDGHGEIIAESRTVELPTWVGLHYPAEDVPAPAREVFKKAWVRPVPDVAGELAEMVPLARPDTGQPLTMTYCALRGPSVMYTEYLRNMGVSAALTMALRRGDELWGLIACHHYGGPKYAPYHVRAACEFVAQMASLQLQGAEERESLAYRLRLEAVHNQLVTVAAQEGGLAAMTDGKLNLLGGLSAGGAALHHSDQWWRVGNTPTDAQLDALCDWLGGRPELDSAVRPLYATDRLPAEYPPAVEYADVASGLLAFPLSRARRGMILWFRPETTQTIQWAGSPHDKPTILGPHGPRLTPRASFERFKESVRHRSLPWQAVELAAAARLRHLILELVVGRAERVAALTADLDRSAEALDALSSIASHDLKEPLRGIQQSARQLIEEGEAIGGENRRRAEGVLRLAARMDRLLDSLLHFARVGHAEPDDAPVDLNRVVAEAVETVASRSADVHREVSVPRPLPAGVWCDSVGCREVFVNLLSNALKYNDRAEKRIEVGHILPGEAHPRPGCPDGAGLHTIYFVRDDGIGIDPRLHQKVFQMFRRLHGPDEYGGGTGAGLAIVKKLVERQGGAVWLDSAPGQGTTVYFTLPGRPGAAPGGA